MLLLRRTLLVLSLLSIRRSGAYSTANAEREFPAAAHSSAALIEKRQSPTVECKRWAQQSAIVNGTLYLYGGRAISTAQQSSNTWNNDFLALDLTKSWQISSPSLTGLAQPSGPPAVALGALWSSYDALFLYGGEYSDTPNVAPATYSLWEYDISSSSWVQHGNPQTSAGVNAPNNNDPVQNAAEGAACSVASLGRGWYFGGHLDMHTTPGWNVPRTYLTSLLEFTFPGYPNTEVQSLSNGGNAGSDGIWRNITEGALKEQAAFPERADGLLVFIPGFGKEGILLGLAGGNANEFQQLNEIDVYDIATSTWYKQATSGSTPQMRVDACAVVAAAADGSSYNVYMYGGQNLQPAGNQTQYSDMWILTVPAFAWIQVDMSGQSVPSARAGHTCNMWNAQMVVFGGYVSTQIECDSPGVYVFNMSSLEWATQYSSMSDPTSNPQSQQDSQIGSPDGLPGNYGYRVPAPVQSIIGGGASGGATVTAPSQSATGGPLATGSAVTYTVTGRVSPTATVSSSTGGSSSNSSSSGGSKIGTIVAGVFAGLLLLLALYLGFCVWLYRKRLQQYRQNIDRFGWMPEKREKRPKIYTTGGVNSLNTFTSSPGYGPLGSDEPDIPLTRRSSDADLLGNQEPTFVGIVLHPRRSLRVTNPD